MMPLMRCVSIYRGLMLPNGHFPTPGYEIEVPEKSVAQYQRFGFELIEEDQDTASMYNELFGGREDESRGDEE